MNRSATARACSSRRSAPPARRGALVSAVLLALAAACITGITPARSLDFKCVEPSRYKHLLQAFNDDPSLITSYFGLTPSQRLDMNACRALVVSGTVRTGDAEALIDQIIAAKGWL